MVRCGARSRGAAKWCAVPCSDMKSCAVTRRHMGFRAGDGPRTTNGLRATGSICTLRAAHEYELDGRGMDRMPHASCGLRACVWSHSDQGHVS